MTFYITIHTHHKVEYTETRKRNEEKKRKNCLNFYREIQKKVNVNIHKEKVKKKEIVQNFFFICMSNNIKYEFYDNVMKVLNFSMFFFYKPLCTTV